MITSNIKNLLTKINVPTKKSLEGSVGACVTRGHYEITTTHLIAQSLEDKNSDVQCILAHFKIDPNQFKTAIQQELKELKVGSTSKPVFSPTFISALEAAWAEASLNLNSAEIRMGSVLLALRKNLNLVPPLLQDHMRLIQQDVLINQFAEITKDSIESIAAQPLQKTEQGADGIQEGSNLDLYTINFTEMATSGKIDPIFGRDDEIRQTIDILSRRRKNNPIFIGEAGVGKTAVVEGLALKIAEGDVPDMLKGVQIRGLDMGLLSAGAGVRGEFENRLKGIISEVKSSAIPIILFIDEAHTMIGAGGEAGKNDAANLLKPELARGDLKCLAATTFTEFRKYFEKDPAIARRFQTVVINEPDPQTAAIMLRGLRQRYESFHGVNITYDAIKAACELSNKFIAGRQLPDKAVDLLDTATARVKMGLTSKPAALQNLEKAAENLEIELGALKVDFDNGAIQSTSLMDEVEAKLNSAKEQIEEISEKWKQELDMVQKIIAVQESLTEIEDESVKEDTRKKLETLWNELEEFQGEKKMVHAHVTPNVVAQVIEEWTGIPAGNMMKDEAHMLLELEQTMNDRVIGQPWGVHEIANTIQSAKMGLTRPETPLGVFLVTGPSGVGKTEVSKTISDLMFGGADNVVTINMSEYQDSMSVTQLKGASAGYVGYGDGGVLTEGVRKNPYTVVILDEVEKAHKDVLNMFYQVFDQGILRDGEGRDINFKNTVIFMTSNLGLDTITNMALEDQDYAYQDYVDNITPELTAHFQPALLARCKVVPFLPLGVDSLQQIIMMKLKKVANRLMEKHKVAFAVSEGVLDKLISQCTQVQSGARLIDTLIDQQILPEISKHLLNNIATGGHATHLYLCLDENMQYNFRFSEGDFDRVDEPEFVNPETVESEAPAEEAEVSENEKEEVSG